MKRIKAAAPTRFRIVQTDDDRFVVVEQVPIGVAYGTRKAAARLLLAVRREYRRPHLILPSDPSV